MYFTEYLPRLNSISVVSDVPDNTTLEDISGVSLNSSMELSIQLKQSSPIKIKSPIPINDLKVSGVKLVNNTLSFSIKLSEFTQETLPFTEQTIDQWSCKDLSRTPEINGRHSFKFICNNCKFLLIESYGFNFKDMPSELWYEMMDFWHCHKPDNHEEHKKDYKGVLKPDYGTIIVGGYYLLQKYNENIIQINDTLTCKSCECILGEMYQDVMRIYKWTILLEYEKDNQLIRESYNSGLFIYNLMVDKINSTATRKFKLEINDKSTFIWVMNLGLNVCVNGAVHDNALKLLVSDDVQNKDDYETLDIPDDEITSKFLQDLTETNKLLPKSIQSLSMGSNKFIVSYLSYK